MCMSGKGSVCKNVGLLLLRVAVGVIFMYQGYGKLTNIDGTTAFFGSLGIPMASVMAYVVGIVEMVGGAMVLLGVFTMYSSIALAVVLLVALFTAHINGPFKGSFLAISLLGSVLALAGVGGGKWSLFHGDHCCKKCGMGGETKDEKGGCCGGSCGGCADEEKKA